MAELTLEDIRAVVREETAGLARASELKAVKKALKNELKAVKTEILELGVKFEDLEKKVDTALESISEDLKLKNKVVDHETRLTTVETDTVLVKSTVASHSRQLKTV